MTQTNGMWSNMFIVTELNNMTLKVISGVWNNHSLLVMTALVKNDKKKPIWFHSGFKEEMIFKLFLTC